MPFDWINSKIFYCYFFLWGTVTNAKLEILIPQVLDSYVQIKNADIFNTAQMNGQNVNINLPIYDVYHDRTTNSNNGKTNCENCFAKWSEVKSISDNVVLTDFLTCTDVLTKFLNNVEFWQSWI